MNDIDELPHKLYIMTYQAYKYSYVKYTYVTYPNDVNTTIYRYFALVYECDMRSELLLF